MVLEADGRLAGSTQSLGDQLANVIGKEIVFRKIMPGEPLRELDLSERFNVSRPAVRDALNRLASLGLVEVLPRRGARAIDFTPEELDDLIGFHAVAFAHACRLAAERRTEREMRDIAAAVDHLVRLAHSDAGPEDYEVGRIACYGAIERAMGPAFVLNQRRAVMARVWNPYAIDTVATAEQRRASAERWQRLAAFIGARDGAGAQAQFLAMVDATRNLSVESCRRWRAHAGSREGVGQSA